MKYLAGAVVNTPVAISGSPGVQPMLADNQLLLYDPSCRAGEFKKILPYGDWEIGEPSLHQ